MIPTLSSIGKSGDDGHRIELALGRTTGQLRLSGEIDLVAAGASAAARRDDCSTPRGSTGVRI